MGIGKTEQRDGKSATREKFGKKKGKPLEKVGMKKNKQKTAGLFRRFSWLGKQDLNLQSTDPESGVLPVRLFPNKEKMELLTGFEPVTYALRVRRSTS